MLQETGIEFEHEDDMEMFSKILEDCLDTRIGSELEKELPDELSVPLGSFPTEEEEKEYLSKIDEWVKRSPLAYLSIRTEEKEKMKNELIKYKNRISGLKKVSK